MIILRLLIKFAYIYVNIWKYIYLYILLQFVDQIKWIKNTVVSCDVTGGITLRTKLKMPIFTLHLPHNLQSRVLVFQKFM